ncbi:hypothetical protein RA210_U580002 [Rubrivivax sp. A210]|uniref:hypothetical protein n=1 Tax=Rubrivivax sp. A210 TaxID=2772301 RepID=UPI001918F7B8|nr:hypothetical protein [Rubrivivax sp. A210]CAD5374414.1 hypothetical protein RA210_U580002 [Rubrivivax sp. A210]
MHPTFESLQRDMAVAVDFLLTSLDAREMPCMHSFPDGACERSAALLAVALARKYSRAQVVYIKGRNEDTNELHFWVEVNDTVLDPTAHQFPYFSAPLLCERPSPLEEIFHRDEIHLQPEVSTDLPYNSNGRWEITLEAMYAAILAVDP